MNNSYQNSNSMQRALELMLTSNYAFPLETRTKSHSICQKHLPLHAFPDCQSKFCLGRCGVLSPTLATILSLLTAVSIVIFNIWHNIYRERCGQSNMGHRNLHRMEELQWASGIFAVFNPENCRIPTGTNISKPIIDE